MRNQNKIFIAFSNEIRTRFLKESSSKDFSTSEDTVRYVFFHALMKVGKYRLEEIELEKPCKDPYFGKSKFDLFVKTKNSYPLVIEFKYHKQHKESAFTSEVGALFWDFAKLVSELDGRKNKIAAYFVYVLRESMKAYLDNPRRKRLRCFFNLKKGSSMRFGKRDIMNLKSIRTWLKDKGYDYVRKFHCKIKSVYLADRPLEECYLRIYKIEK